MVIQRKITRNVHVGILKESAESEKCALFETPKSAQTTLNVSVSTTCRRDGRKKSRKIYLVDAETKSVDSGAGENPETSTHATTENTNAQIPANYL